MSNQESLTRRTFLSGTAAMAGGLMMGCASNKATTAKVAQHQWRLGMDTYTLHRSLTAKDPALKRSLFETMSILPKHGITGIQIDPSHYPGNDDKTFGQLREVCQAHDMYVEFGMGGWDPNRMAERIEYTSRFGGRALRTFFSGEHAKWEQLKEWMNYAEQPFKEAGDVAAKHNVYVAIENHGDFTGPQLREFIERVNHPRVGVCFDTANALFRREDPIECAEALAPYAYSMHLKDWTTTVDAKGEVHWREATLGTGEIPMEKVLSIVAKHQKTLYVAMETPVAPSDNEAEMVKREWANFKACSKAARKYVADINAT